MAELEKKPVKIVETVLRDAHQSLIATRLPQNRCSRSLIKWTKSATTQ